MKKLLLFLFFPTIAFSQASVGYYPFSGLFTVSSNPNKLVWVDGRLQTNTPFSLATTVCPLINVVRKEQVNYYVGPGVRVNVLNSLSNAKLLEGYSLHIGARVAPIRSVPGLRVALELAPFVNNRIEFGLVQSFFGVTWQFAKKP